MSPYSVHRIDTTQAAMVEAMEQVGAGVTSLTSVGGGVSDLLVSFRATWFVIEAKTPGGKLRPKQWVWIGKQRAPVHICETPEDALIAIGALEPTRRITGDRTHAR